MYDLHIHTRNSPDSQATPDEIAAAVLEKGLDGIALTDHVDLGYIYSLDELRTFIEGSHRDAARIEELSDGRFTVLRGMELGGIPYDPRGAQQLIDCTAFDVVLGSVHGVIMDGKFLDSYSMDFSTRSIEEIDVMLNAYFDLMLELVSTADVDVLTHLTYPFRYINGKYGRGIDEMRYRDRITAVFRKIIERDIALEVNTASVDRFIYDFVPSSQHLALYRSLGGRRVTLGSDAHVADRIALSFEQAKKMLASLGFTEYYYYKERRPIAVPLG